METSVSGLHTSFEAKLSSALNTDCQDLRLFPGAEEEIEAGSPVGGSKGSGLLAPILLKLGLIGRGLSPAVLRPLIPTGRLIRS